MQTNTLVSKEEEERMRELLKRCSDRDMLALLDMIKDIVFHRVKLKFDNIDSEKENIAYKIFLAFFTDREKYLNTDKSYGQIFSVLLKRVSFTTLCEQLGIDENAYNVYLTLSKIKEEYQIPLIEDNAYKFFLLCPKYSMLQIMTAVDVDIKLHAMNFDEQYEEMFFAILDGKTLKKY